MKKDIASYIFILIVIGIYVILAVVMMVVAYNWTISVGGKIDDFTKTAVTWGALLTSLLTAVISIYVAHRQKSASTELEALRAQLTSNIETLKAQLATNLEFLKARFSAERKAYDELFSAALTYYHTLARLEIGAWDRVRTRKAEDGMLAACRYTIAVEEEHKHIWYQIWQRSRALSEEAKELKDKESRKELWRTNVKEYGKLLATFQEVASAKHMAYASTRIEDI